MIIASIQEIKKELHTLEASQLQELCLRLAKYKKENKELLTYLLYEAGDEDSYIASVKEEMDELFEEVNTSSIYFAKKTFRKILRTANKYIRYSGKKTTEIELLVHYLRKLKASRISIRRSPQMMNLYQRQMDKIAKSVNTLHEDLQYDYQQEMKELVI